LKTAEFVTNNYMVIITHPTYLLDLAPVFFLFPKLKMKVKGRFETAPETQRELQEVLDSIKKNGSHGAFEVWKKW
jgi:hypothetical protein